MAASLEIISTAIPEVKLVRPVIHRDARGFFSETYNQKALAEAGISDVFVQDNHSCSAKAGVVRGLHFQKPPRAQSKLIRVVSGRILDVAVDIRHGSPTFGQHVTAELSRENWNQLWIPAGFAHAFCTLEENTEVIYKVTDYYSPQEDAGILWNDPALGIKWPIANDAIILSDKDKSLPRLSELGDIFKYEPTKAH